MACQHDHSSYIFFNIQDVVHATYSTSTNTDSGGASKKTMGWPLQSRAFIFPNHTTSPEINIFRLNGAP
jgi:hypothetical protein